MADTGLTFADFAKAYKLSPQQGKIAALVMQAVPNRAIGKRMNTSEQCIKNAVGIIYRKLQIEGTTNNKRLRLFVMANDWAKQEKQRRITEAVNV